MKELQRIARLLASDWCWPLTVAIAKRTSPGGTSERLFQRVLFERVMSQHAWIESTLRETLKSTTVSGGPLSGLRYPDVVATCSTIAPKLLGTYESEITHCFSIEQMTKYEVFVDVGCAEGFYAVGVACAVPNAKVDAYDINPEARDLCRRLAEYNEVADRVAVKTECTSTTLASYAGKRALIISDCEGAEMSLFTPTIIQSLPDADFVIEVHEHLGADGDELRNRFESTHRCESIRCLMDLDRLRRYRHQVLDDLSDAKRILLVAECRSRGNGWLIAQSRN